MDEFPPNSERSRAAKDPSPEQKNIKRVVSEEPSRRKRSLGKRLKETFVAGDPKQALHYVVLTVLIPAARQTVTEFGRGYLDRLIYGDSLRGQRRGMMDAREYPTGRFDYAGISKVMNPTSPTISTRGRARHDFDEIILSNRVEAETIIETMFEILSKYPVVSVADLYEMCGIKPSHIDTQWGWTDLLGASVSRTRNGFLLDLPEPEPIG